MVKPQVCHDFARMHVAPISNTTPFCIAYSLDVNAALSGSMLQKQLICSLLNWQVMCSLAAWQI